MTRPILIAALALAPAMANAQELVTRNRVGLPDAPNTLTFRLTAYDLYSSDPATSEAFEEMFRDFIEARPDWKIETQLQTGNIGQEQARLLQQTRAGRGPDCAMIDSSQLATFRDAGVLQPMNAVFSDEDVADLFPYVREAVTDEAGNVLAWWWFTDLRVLYRDTSVVPEAPQTWEDTREAALAAVEAGKEGILFNGGRWEGTAFDWLGNFWAQGGRLVDDEGGPVFAEGENRAKFLEAVAYYQDLVESGAAPRRVTSITDYDAFNAAAAAGTAAMFVGGNWQYGQMRNTLDPEAFENWEVSELPGPTADQRATGTGGWSIAALSDDPEKAELCGEIGKEIYAGPGNAFQGLLPTSEATYDEYDAYDGPEFDLFAEALQNGVARPGAAIYPEISNQIQILLGNVLSGTSTPEEALDAAASAVQAAYDRQ
ncbi:extracellular solute-binding protein [Allosediminivita pacifica]|uniref:Carbohydrate ABC transporter substrate-binding protein (CUT1 family) n=1 Tax=Allosediminivita pacifica TaxID=1267769 RepID=A0A2T6ABB0_9RHOB|nr:extracellular solute-binding protein [Allosediminivita pacifica]PTX41106.1 carbohydrate ABC transporter substrate-binding protein (CUT1 family) [Allosediminivita pacifica]GGB25096.1 sugar ABC transporter substrate-binding protein [Allosediminivita pacifica]